MTMLCEHGVSGIIFISGEHADTLADHSSYQALVERRLPIVLVNGYADGHRRAVHLDRRRAPRPSWPSSTCGPLGHRRIGLAVGPERFVPAVRKIAGFRRAMRDLASAEDLERLGRAVDLLGRGRAGGGAAAGRARLYGDRLRLGPDGAGRDPRRALARACEVPDDVSVVGYDDSAFVAFTDPPLTTVHQSRAGDGRGGGARPDRRDQRPAGAAHRVRLPARAGRARARRRGSGRSAFSAGSARPPAAEAARPRPRAGPAGTPRGSRPGRP